MNDIIRLLPKLLDASDGNREVAESVAKVAWTRAVGEGLRRHAVPVRLAGSTLVVVVADAAWRAQLQAMSSELLASVNRVLGRDLIKFIEFRVDPNGLESMRGEARPIDHTEFAERALNLVPIEVITAAESIQDESLRQHFLLAAAAAAMRKQSGGAEI